MRFLVMTDIEGVTGVTSYRQAENDPLGREMLMHDLRAVLRGISEAGAEAIVYDMHTDGRNPNLSELNVPVIMGKPILPTLWRGIGGDDIAGLFLVGLHAMQHTRHALLAHSYLREYDAIFLNGLQVGEIGMEAALAGEQGIPLKFVSGDDIGCKEGRRFVPSLVTCAVKTSLTADSAVCLPPAITGPLLTSAAKSAVLANIRPFSVTPPYEIRIVFSACPLLSKMHLLHPDIFENENTVIMHGEALLPLWSEYLRYEREALATCL